MKSKKKVLNKPVRSQQVPATAAMLYEVEERLVRRMDAGFESVRAEFKSELKSEVSPIKSDVGELKSDVRQLKSDVSQLRSDFRELRSEVKSDIGQLRTELRAEFKSEFSSLKSELHRVALLVEEQNARNKYVMDGYAQIYDLLVHRSAD